MTFYPRSLLYFVSGVVERNRAHCAGPAPIVGQRRYYEQAWYDADEDIDAVAAFLEPTQVHHRVVWSPTRTGEPKGFRAGAESHPAFDDDPAVLDSLRQIIRG